MLAPSFLLFSLALTPHDHGKLVDAVTAASAEMTELHKAVLACRSILEETETVSNRITGEDAVLCVQLPSKSLKLVRVLGGISRTDGYTVQLIRRNGANSDYKVVRPEGGKVLGIKTNVTSIKVKAGTKLLKIKGKHGHSTSKRVQLFKERAVSTIYAPYSEAVREPAAIRHGFDYVVSMIDEARDSLDQLGVTSRLDLGKPIAERRLVTEVVPEKPVVPLIIIEHIDPIWIDEKGVRHSVERVLVTIGLNGKMAYCFASSSAAANGIAQFIKPTYDRIRKAYPEAQLMPDYMEGMRNHLNAMKAQFLLADYTLTALSQESRDKLMDGQHEEELGAYIAAAYNGGEHYAAPAYDNDSVTWDHSKPPLVAPKKLKGKKRDAWYRSQLIKQHRIPAQTVTYVREFRQVYEYLFVHHE